MMKKINLVAALTALLLFSNLAIASTTLPLNTGYNHSIFNPYPTVTINPSPPGARDNYWINIASYQPTLPPVGPTWILRNPGWMAAFPNTNWIGARNTAYSPTGTTAANPGYTIFRKCFCLLPNFKEAKLSFQVRADDTIQIWLNTQLNQVLAPSWGNHSGPALSASTTKGFRVGPNCLYALVEDFGGAMGFDLVGSVSAYGLLPMPAAGTNQSFEPCACRQGHPDTAEAASTLRVEDDDRQIISEIVKMAEARRAAKQKRQYEGTPPQREISPERIGPGKQLND
jgi:hypothetical protein